MMMPSTGSGRLCQCLVLAAIALLTLQCGMAAENKSTGSVLVRAHPFRNFKRAYLKFCNM